MDGERIDRVVRLIEKADANINLEYIVGIAPDLTWGELQEVERRLAQRVGDVFRARTIPFEVHGPKGGGDA